MCARIIIITNEDQKHLCDVIEIVSKLAIPHYLGGFRNPPPKSPGKCLHGRLGYESLGRHLGVEVFGLQN